MVASWISASKRETEAALRQARDQLEFRVAERTTELQESLVELREKEREREQLEYEKSALSDKLEVRKLVERAKGIPCSAIYTSMKKTPIEPCNERVSERAKP